MTAAIARITGRSEQILLNQVGCEARNIPGDAGVFFLDFYLL